MQKLSIFYLIFVICFSALPCSDEQEEYDFIQNTSVNVTPGVEKGKMESCSPICACTCCGQSVVEIELTNLAIKPALNSVDKQISNYQFLLQHRNTNVWHPPKKA